MIRHEKFIIFLLTFFFLNCAQHQEVEAIKWISGSMSEFAVMKETFDLLDKLHMIQMDNPEEKKDILELIHMLNLKIRDFSNNFKESRKKNLKVVSSFFPTEMGQLVKIENKINASYYNMMKLVVKRKEGKNNTAESEVFARQNILGNSEMFEILTKYLGYHGNFSNIDMVDNIASHFLHDKCLPISVQQHFYTDYLSMTILGIKEYLVKKFSWAFLPHSKTKTFRVDEEKFLREHENRMRLMARKFRGLINDDQGELIKCDPNRWIEHKNYEQLTRLIQGYVVNEVNLNSWGSCKYNCEHYSDSETYTCQEHYCKRDKGAGKISSCESVFNRDSIIICPSQYPERRYDFLEFNQGDSEYSRYFGPKLNSCYNSEFEIFSYLRFPYACTYCFCLLEEKGKNSDRFFNLREVVSDVKNNKVVTGVRFIKKNRIIYLQIQQGELAPLGMIKENSTEWKRVEEYELRKEGDGVDYITFDNKRRAINLDDVKTLNQLYLVTGIRLSMLESHLRLEVRVNPYSFELGRLIFPESRSKWINDSSIHSKKKPLKGREGNRGPNVPTKSPLKSLPSRVKYDFVEFTHSDKIDDAAQTTLPFIDTQDVVSYSPTPLSGIGLYHKGFDGYGGFIAPKIYTLDLSAKI